MSMESTTHSSEEEPPTAPDTPTTEAEARARGLCGAETRGGTPCQKHPVEGGSRCRFHGGQSTGPTDTEYLEDNDHAVGNGGGAPEGNTNALVSGAFTPLDRMPELLTREQLHGVARWEWWAVLASRQCDPDLDEARRRRLAQRWARLRVRSASAMMDAWAWDRDESRGLTIERNRTVETSDGEQMEVTEHVMNPSVDVKHRAENERWDIRSALGLGAVTPEPVPDPDRRANPGRNVPFSSDGATASHDE